MTESSLLLRQRKLNKSLSSLDFLLWLAGCPSISVLSPNPPIDNINHKQFVSEDSYERSCALEVSPPPLHPLSPQWWLLGARMKSYCLPRPPPLRPERSSVGCGCSSSSAPPAVAPSPSSGAPSTPSAAAAAWSCRTPHCWRLATA